MSLSYKHTGQDSKAKQGQDSVRPQSSSLLKGHTPTKSMELQPARVKTEMERLV